MSTVKGTREKCNFSVQTVKCDAKKRAMMGRRYNRELIVLRYRTISSIRKGKKICGMTQMTPVDESGLIGEFRRIMLEQRSKIFETRSNKRHT